MERRKKTKKKVLHIVDKYATTGGIGTVIDYLTEGINEHEKGEFEVDKLITSYDNKNLKPGPSQFEPTYGRKRRLNSDAYYSGKLEELIGEYDIVHIHGIPNYATLETITKLKEKKGTKIVNTAHSSVKKEFMAQHEAAKGEVDKNGERRPLSKDYASLETLRKGGILDNPSKFGETYWGSAISRQEKIMTLSDSVQHMNEVYKRELIDEYLAQENEDKHIVIPNGVRIVEETTDRPNKKRLLYVGRFAKEKGIDEFIESIPYILEEHPDAEIKLVGGDRLGKSVKFYRDKLRRKMSKHFRRKVQSSRKMMGRVHFTGWIDDKDKLEDQYRWTDYVLIPSKDESFSLTASEALMHKRVPIITRTKAMDDLYISKGIALGIEEGERHAEGLAKRVNEIFNEDSGLHSEIADRGREFVLKNYTIDNMVNLQLDNYKKLLKNKKKDGNK